MGRVQTQERRKEPAERIPSGVLKLEFGAEDAFGKELRRRVDDFFHSSGHCGALPLAAADGSGRLICA